MTRATRIEYDSLGPVEVPADRLWGAQTERSRTNFAISRERMPPELISALALVKKAAALVNIELGTLDQKLGRAIVQAADEVITSRHENEFPLVVWQTGSGTQTNMNMNEVLANRASEILGGARGQERLVHPNDHVNQSQSSNDVFPSAMSIAATAAVVHRVMPAVQALRDVLSSKADAYATVVKVGRTHLMDATPITLGQEISGWASQLSHGLEHVRSALGHLGELALGGTAVGTGLNSKRAFAEQVAAKITSLSGYRFETAPNKFEAMAAHDAFVFAHGALKTLAVSLYKIANDVRWLASGPRAGLAELRLPENEPGSSIMPGKVNPTQSEALIMAMIQVMANDVAINGAGAAGHFELNLAKPLIIHAFLHSCRLIADGCVSFNRHCAVGIEANYERIREHLESSLMLVTALNQRLGYDQAAKIARKAHLENKTLRQAALELGLLSAEDFDRFVRPELMLGPSD